MNAIELKQSRNSMLGRIRVGKEPLHYTATILEFTIANYSHRILVHNLQVNFNSKNSLIGDGHKWLKTPVDIRSLGFIVGDAISFKGLVSKYHNREGNGFDLQVIDELQKVEC